MDGMMVVEDYITQVSWRWGCGRAWQNISLCSKVEFLGHIVVVSSLNQFAINYTNNWVQYDIGGNLLTKTVKSTFCVI